MGKIIEWGAICDRGTTRPDNQDSVFVWLPDVALRLPDPDGSTGSACREATLPVHDNSNSARNTRIDFLALVADGMGGPPGGAQASHQIIETVADAMEQAEATDPPAFLRDLLNKCDSDVFAWAGRLDLRGMGSTCTLLALAGTALHLCHVGDSRCYRISPAKGSIEQWSKDHNIAAQLVKGGVLTPEEARNHRASHALTQAVGLGQPLDPQIERSALIDEEEIFLLCSDGLLRVLNEREILEAFLQPVPHRKDKERAAAAAVKNDMQVVAQQLLDLANERGSPDNVSAIAIRLRPEP
ncbi:MAG: serine/threonine-protein phosphatase [Candidatus Eisenbacteria sp.]|nr:serine/threonine-protein phosphatase [Candidatus Eisenbacteria bacterium]